MAMFLSKKFLGGGFTDFFVIFTPVVPGEK